MGVEIVIMGIDKEMIESLNLEMIEMIEILHLEMIEMTEILHLKMTMMITL